MKKNFNMPEMKIKTFSPNVALADPSYPGYQRVIDSLKSENLDREPNIVKW